jgi:hypothetical protein
MSDSRPPEIYDPSDERSIKALQALVEPIGTHLAAAHRDALSSQEKQAESNNRHRLEVLRISFEHQNKVLGKLLPVFWGGIVAGLLFMGGAFYVGRPDIALNGVVFAFGWLGGYGYGNKRQESARQ